MSTFRAKLTHEKPADAPADYGPRLPTGEPRACRGCGRGIDPEQRVHVCRACRVRKCRGTEVGEACACCGLPRRDMLVLRAIEGERVSVCGNCAVVLGRRPLSLEELRAEVTRAA